MMEILTASAPSNLAPRLARGPTAWHHLAMTSTRLPTALLLAAALLMLPSTRADEPAALPESVQIRNVQFGLLLRPRDANNKDGTPLVLYPAQPWRCMTWTTHATAEGIFSLKNRFTSKTFANSAEGAIKQIPFDAAKAWKFEKLADGHYRILDPASPTKALTARDEHTLVLDDWKDIDGQKWEVLTAPAHLTM